jgi:glycosyltransferase involved in cell wall biosynthesis
MKVLHISGARGWGGNERQLIDVIPELEKLGVENHVFGVDKSSLQKECIKQNTPFIECQKDRLNKFVNYKYLKAIVKQLKPDIIHLHTSDSLTVYTLSDLLFRLRVKTVFSKKGMGRSSSFLSKYKYNYKNVNRIICVSNAVKIAFSEILHKHNRNKLVVIYDGINLNRTDTKTDTNIRELLHIPKDKYVIGNIANHTNAKDLPTLMKMLNHLVNVKQIKNVHLVQIGNFSDNVTPLLKNLIQEFNIQDYITLTDFRDDALDLLEQMDVYVMSSEREGLPLTVFEAFLKKAPVVSTKAGGIPEAIEHDYNGYLSDVRDYEDLADNIAKLLVDKDKQELFKERSYQLFFKRFTAQKTAENTFNLYKEIRHV